MRFIPLALLLLSVTSYARGTSEACRAKANTLIEINVIASNIANANTTRTPEGGPYKPKRLVCKNQICEIIELPQYLIKYLPDHPDADESGYVRFPYIDFEQQTAQMIRTSDAYNLAQRDCP